jgi:cell division protein FtsQ
LAISIPLRAESSERRSVDPRVRLLVGVGVVALAVGGLFLSRSSVLHARGIDVVGASHLDRADVIAVAGVSTRTNVIWLDEAAVERRLEANAWIADADVRLALPWTIELSVVERFPVAIATDGMHETLVAADGTVLGPVGRVRGLPRIELLATGALDGARESPRGAAAAVGAMSPELRAQVGVVRVLVDGTLEIRLRGGVVVRYGPGVEARRKASAIERILAWADAEGERIAVVNVVAPDRPAVKLAP